MAKPHEPKPLFTEEAEEANEAKPQRRLRLIKPLQSAQPLDPNVLTAEELNVIDEKLLAGVVSRASVLSFLFSFIFAAYSFTSYSFLKNFEPDLTLFDNTWPRLLFNSLPSLVLAIYFRDYRHNVKFKALLWLIGFPFIFMLACMIHVWPLVWAGKSEVYLYVHSANFFVVATTLIMSAPPPRYLALQVASVMLFFITPIFSILLRGENELVLKLFLGDLTLGLPTVIYTSHFIYKLRHKIARFDVKIKNAATPFLGSTLADAIYNNRQHLLESRQADAVVVMMDIRGFTDFHQNGGVDIVRAFMTEYHSMVSRHIGRFGGFWHKSVGDAQLASFGAMDTTADLDDIPGLETEKAQAKQKKKSDQFTKCLRSLFAIADDFEKMKIKFDITNNLSLGIGVSYGTLEIRVQGDQAHKKELDIDGDVVIRAARLEAYSKVVRKKVAPTESVLILSPELEDVMPGERVFQPWATDRVEMQVPNYPSLTHVQYHVFRHHLERRASVLKIRSN